MARRMSPDETLFRLALADWDRREVTRWWRAGIRDAGFARAATDARLGGLGVVQRWWDSGVRTAADLTKHRRLSMTDTVVVFLAANGVVDPVAQRKVVRTQISTRWLDAWARLASQFSWSLDDIVTMHTAAAIPPSAAQLATGGCSPARIAEIHTAGIGSTGFYAFVDAGLGSIDEMRRWVDAGFDGVTARHYLAVGARDVDHASALNAGGVTPEVVNVWGPRSLRPPLSRIAEIAAAGVPAEDAAGYTRNQIHDVADMVRLREVGITGGDADKFARWGLGVPDEMIDALRRQDLPWLG